jgi:hypothetical protein
MCGTAHRESDLDGVIGDSVIVAIVSALTALAAVIYLRLGIRVVLKRPDVSFGHTRRKPLAKYFSTELLASGRIVVRGRQLFDGV